MSAYLAPVGLRARLRKLRVMPPAEAVDRVVYSAFLALERRRVMGAERRPEQVREALARRGQHLLGAQPSNRGRIFPAVAEAGRMAALFQAGAPYACHGAASRRAAEAAQRQEFEFFGQRFTYEDEIDWHADPVTGRSWPRVYHAEVPIHQGGAPIGDVKYVWELNRHQFLMDLAKTSWLYSDERSAAALYAIVRHWLGENPYGVGVNWSCALEPAFRVWSWLWAYDLCAGDPSLDDRTHAMWLAGLEQHGRFLFQHLEYYSSPYNHLIGEASALYALGLAFPEMRNAQRWRERGRGVLVTSLPHEFHADGGSVEQSTFYHHATLGFYVLAAVLGDAHGDPFPAPVHEAIERAIDFSMALMQPDGRVPSIGGADDGKPVRLEHLPFWDFRAYQAFGAVRYGRRDFRFAAGDFHEDALWLLGPDGRDQFDAMEPVEPASARTLPDSGYHVLRTGWTADADYLCFDCGDQAAGLRRDDVPSAAHGHADCLSIVLWLRGRPVLVDPGFYCYNGDPAWEYHFRSTGAHNTARIDSRDQSRHVHKMAWARVFAPAFEAWMPATRGGAAGGSHDGYACGEQPVVHRRAVWLHESGNGLVCDQFSGTGVHDTEITYQLAPGSATLAADGWVIHDHAMLVWVASVPITAALKCGGPGPDEGWIAPSLGVKRAAPKLVLSAQVTEPVTTVLTLVAPPQPPGVEHPVVSITADMLAVGCRSQDSTVQWFGMPAGPIAMSARELIDWLCSWSEDATPLAATARARRCEAS